MFGLKSLRDLFYLFFSVLCVRSFEDCFGFWVLELGGRVFRSRRVLGGVGNSVGLRWDGIGF